MSLPETMTAIGYEAPGGPDVLVPVTRPVPAPGPGEILVRLAAAGVNRPDVLQRQGGYPPPKGASDIPGLEIAGTVVAQGPGAGRFALGASVVGLVAGGGYAEYAVVHESNALPVPRGLDLVATAGIPETFFTVWSNVFDRAGLKPGETFMVHGGTSGIGTTAIQLAKAFGATVIATAGSDDKCAACLELGADHAINYRTEDFAARVREITGGQGVKVVYDSVGKDTWDKSLECLRPFGLMASFGNASGPVPPFAPAELGAKGLYVTRGTLFSHLRTRESVQAMADDLFAMVGSGQVKIHIAQRFALAQVADAHRALESRATTGSTILTV